MGEETPAKFPGSRDDRDPRGAALQRDGQALAACREGRAFGERLIAAPPRIRSLAQACVELRSPYASEAFSPLTGEGLLVVDLSTPGPDEHELELALAGLGELPCPALGFGNPRDAAATALGAALDVAEPDEAALAPVLTNVTEQPIAAMALVQLLRGGQSRTVHEGLLAESLVYSMLQSGPEFLRWRSARAEKPLRESLRPAVSTARSGPRLDIALDRPEKHNAFSADMRDGLAEALRIAVGDSSITEIALRGRGPSFCSGGDLDEFGSFPDPATAHAVRATRNPARLLHAVADRTRVFVHGACVGAGVELPAFTRRVTAVGDAFFQLPEVQMGLVPGAGGTVSLPRRIGRQRTAWLALSCERISLERALGWGIVDERA